MKLEFSKEDLQYLANGLVEASNHLHDKFEQYQTIVENSANCSQQLMKDIVNTAYELRAVGKLMLGVRQALNEDGIYDDEIKLIEANLEAYQAPIDAFEKVFALSSVLEDNLD